MMNTNMENNKIFQENVWYKILSELLPQYTIPTIFINSDISKKIISKINENPIQSQQEEQVQINNNNKQQQDNEMKQIQKQINQILKKYPKGTYLKILQKSAKDLWKGQHNLLLLKIKSCQDIINLLNYSDYLLNHINIQNQQTFNNIFITLRKYCKQLQHQHYQYRVYVKSGIVIGYCQKYLHHFGQQNFQVINVSKIIINKLQIQQCVLQIYCSPTNKIYLLGISPYYVNQLSLFKFQQLQQFHRRYLQQKNQFQPLVKVVNQISQLKEEDFSDFITFKQFDNMDNIKEWIKFANNSQKI